MFKRAFLRLVGTACLSVTMAASHAQDDAALDAHVHALAAELRCVVCQNQSLADSDAALARDLRETMRTMLRNGSDDAAVRAFIVQRYGDFVLYRPPWKPSTLVLWCGPAALLAGGLLALLVVLKRRARMPDANFEPDPLEPEHSREVAP